LDLLRRTSYWDNRKLDPPRRTSYWDIGIFLANLTDFETDKSIMEIDIRQLRKEEPPPYHLLELADPSRKVIDDYLPGSEIYLAENRAEIIGVYVLYPPEARNTIEIKNIAVLPEFQGKGLGKLMLKHAGNVAQKKGYKKLRIATANSSVAQLHLYLSQGFLLQEIIPDFFIHHYEEPIFENGVQCRDLMVLEKKLI